MVEVRNSFLLLRMASEEGPVYGGGVYSNGGSLPRNSPEDAVAV